MHDARIYNDKIPNTVLAPMLEFTGSDCFLVKHRRTGATSKGANSNCHTNVQDWVEKKGGERVSGWLLGRVPQFINEGIWAWMFHSIWLTPEGKYADVTMDDVYAGKEFVTFWPDKNRVCDLENGTSYNNIVVFGNDAIAHRFSSVYKYGAEKGKLYWSLDDMSQIRSMDQHVGLSKYLNSQYVENIKHLEQQYNAVMNGDQLQLRSEIDKSKTNLRFDFFISL